MAQEGKKPRKIATSAPKAGTPAPTEATGAKGDANAKADAEADVDGGAPRPWLLLVGIVLLTAVVYAPALGGPFLWDDRSLIEQSGRVKDLSSWSSLFTGGFWAGTTQEDISGAYFRPLSTLSFAVDYALHEGNPAGYHLTNLVLHLACVGLFFGWLRKQGLRLGTVALATSLWALAPRLAECVAWISGRTDVLAGLFSLGALRLWTSSGERSKARDALACALLFAGLLSKEVALAAVVACAVHAWLSPPRLVARVLAPLATFGVYLGLRARALAEAPSWEHQATSATERVTLVLESIGRYALMIVDAWRPRAQIGYRGDPSEAWAGVGLCVLLALAAGAVLLSRRRLTELPVSGITAGTLALVGLGLVVHVIPLPIYVVNADRFLYVPLLGVFCVAALAVDRWLPTPRPAHGVLAAGLVGASGLVSFQRAGLFADDVAFWVEAVETSDARNLLPTYQMGTLYSRASMNVEALDALGRSQGWGKSGRKGYATQLLRAGRCGEAREIFDALAASAGTLASGVRSSMCLGELTEARARLVAARQVFPDDAGLAALERDLSTLESEPEPSARPDGARAWEARALRLSRAARRTESLTAWLEVARSDDATAEQLETAAARLLEEAPLAEATEAVERAHRRELASREGLRLWLEERIERERKLREAARRLEKR